MHLQVAFSTPPWRHRADKNHPNENRPAYWRRRPRPLLFEAGCFFLLEIIPRPRVVALLYLASVAVALASKPMNCPIHAALGMPLKSRVH